MRLRGLMRLGAFGALRGLTSHSRRRSDAFVLVLVLNGDGAGLHGKEYQFGSFKGKCGGTYVSGTATTGICTWCFDRRCRAHFTRHVSELGACALAVIVTVLVECRAVI